MGDARLLSMLVLSQQWYCPTWPQWAAASVIFLQLCPETAKISGSLRRAVVAVPTSRVGAVSTHAGKALVRCNRTMQQSRQDPAYPPL
jgi:hypothetical protein